MRKKIFYIGSACLLLLAITVIKVNGLSSFEQTKRVEDFNNKIKIGIYNGDFSALMIWAKQKALFKEQGIEVEFVFYDSGKNAMDAMLEGKVDYANCADFVAIKNSFKSKNFNILASMATVNINGLLVKNSSGIKSPTQLQGKTIATTIGTASEYYAGVFLEQYNYQKEDVNLIHVETAKRYDVMKDENIDAIFTWNPFNYNIQKKYKKDISIYSMPYSLDFYFVLVVDKAFHKQNRSVSSKILKALIKAQKDVAQENEFKNFIKEYFNFDEEYVNYAFKNYEFDIALHYPLSINLQNQASWLLANNLVDGDIIDFNILFDSEVLSSIDNTVVTILE